MAMRRNAPASGGALGVVIILVLLAMTALPPDPSALPFIGVIAVFLLVVALARAVGLRRTQLGLAPRGRVRTAPPRVVGPLGEVSQLGAPHAGYHVEAPTYPPVAPEPPAAWRPASSPSVSPRPRQNPTAAPRQQSHPRPASPTRALSGSCLFGNEWRPSALQESSLHRPD